MNLPKDLELLLFDIDGTIVQTYNDTEPLPGRREFFSALAAQDECPYIAFVTNQGGVCVNWWLDKQGKPEADKYPTLHDVSRRLNKIFVNLKIIAPKIYINYCYQDIHDGHWWPTPYDLSNIPENMKDDLLVGESYGVVTPDEWKREFRKPAPGMILKACQEFQVKRKDKVLFVGDRPEDLGAANNAGVKFTWAKEFFMT